MTGDGLEAKAYLNKYLVPSIAKALRTLEFMVESKSQRFTLTQLHRDLDIPVGTLFKVLATLEQYEYVVKEDDSNYVLGPGMINLALGHTRKFDLKRVARPAMEELAKSTKETVECGIINTRRWKFLVIEKVDGIHAIRLFSNVGVLLELHTTAGGKVMLAYQPPNVLDRFLEEYGLPPECELSISDPEKFREHLKQVKKRGYAMDFGEARPEVSRLAAPVRNVYGYVIGAVGIAGPTFRLTPERLQELVPEVVSTAERISNLVPAYGGTQF